MVRLVHKADFERVLATRSLKRSAHFALHHVPAMPQDRSWRGNGRTDKNLSTRVDQDVPASVDKSALPETPHALWVGWVVPKRHARRAVTRSLLKRQMRAAFDRQAAGLPRGMWLLRLRAPFSATEFVSARSAPLAAMVRGELDRLLAAAAG